MRQQSMARGKTSKLSRQFLRLCQDGDPSQLDRLKSLVSEHGIEDWTLLRHAASEETALHLVARAGHVAYARYLCQQLEPKLGGLEVSNRQGKRPLHEAAQFGRFGMLEYLLELGAEVDALRAGDWTPLMLAASSSEHAQPYRCVELLLRHGADAFLKNKDGWTAMLLACRAGHHDVVLLLRSHAQPLLWQTSNNRRSLLHVAALHARMPTIRYLMVVSTSELIERRDSTGSTPLHEAVKSRQLVVLQYMIERINARYRDVVNSPDNIGQNLLHIAAAVGCLPIMKYLLDLHVMKLSDKDNFGSTPLQIAQRHEHKDIIEFLSKTLEDDDS